MNGNQPTAPPQHSPTAALVVRTSTVTAHPFASLQPSQHVLPPHAQSHHPPANSTAPTATHTHTAHTSHNTSNSTFNTPTALQHSTQPTTTDTPACTFCCHQHHITSHHIISAQRTKARHCIRSRCCQRLPSKRHTDCSIVSPLCLCSYRAVSAPHSAPLHRYVAS